MISKLHKLYVKKIDYLFEILQTKFEKKQLTLESIDVLKINIESLLPESFTDFNCSTNSLKTIFCDEEKLENYNVKLRNINATISTNKDVYNFLYTTPIKEVKVKTFFLSEKGEYINEVDTVKIFKERSLNYLLIYNKLKESENSKDQLNHFRLINFTDNLNDTVCSLLKLQT